MAAARRARRASCATTSRRPGPSSTGTPPTSEFHESYRRRVRGQRNAGARAALRGASGYAWRRPRPQSSIGRSPAARTSRSCARWRAEAACEHAGYFDSSARCSSAASASDRVGLIASWRALRTACRSARDYDVACGVRAARASLGRRADRSRARIQCEFRARMVPLIAAARRLGPIERLLFRPWLERGSIARPRRKSPSSAARRLPLAPQLAGCLAEMGTQTPSRTAARKLRAP